MNSRRASLVLLTYPLLSYGAGTTTDVGQKPKARTPREVAQRALALLAVVRQAQKHPEARGWVRRNRVSVYFSSMEAKFFQTLSPTQEQRVQFSWRAEALIPLLWALKAVDSMPQLNERVQLDSIVEWTGLWKYPGEFVAGASLRSLPEMYKARSQAYDANWKARDAFIHGRPSPPEIDPEVVQERHHGLNWLVGDSGDDWDRITTDT